MMVAAVIGVDNSRPLRITLYLGTKISTHTILVALNGMFSN